VVIGVEHNLDHPGRIRCVDLAIGQHRGEFVAAS